MEGNLLYSRSADLNVNLYKNAKFMETSKVMFDHISRKHGPVKVT